MGRPAPSKGAAWGKHYFILGSIALLALCGYLNATFYIQNQSTSQLRHHNGGYHKATSEIPHLVFTSTCAKRDVVRAKVFAFTLRDVGFKGQVTHVLHNCGSPEYHAISGKANPYNVTYFHSTAVKGSTAKELNPAALLAWLDTVTLPPNEFVAIFEVDSIFTRSLDLPTLLAGANTIENPTAIAQDAAWYDADEPAKIMPVELLEKAVGLASKALQVEDWRDFAVHAPLVLHAKHIGPVFDRVVAIAPQLDTKHKHLAYALASAEVDLRHGVTGSLRLSRYNSFAENWNFVDVTRYNPANATISPSSPEYPIYPFSLRTATLSLPLWAGGKAFNMIDTLVPLDFFDCNAWLLEPLPLSMWYYAQNTFGWEGLSTILRTRHTVAVAAAYRAYNRAALDHKRRSCKAGFNENARLSLLPENPLTSAVSKAAHLSGNEPATPTHHDALHFVFASGCAASDHVAADLLAQSFARVQQPGQLTRLVSGCTTAEQVAQVRTRTPRAMTVHFIPTPMTTVDALNDWLAKSNVPLAADATMVLLASDFVFLRAFRPDGDIPIVSTLAMDPEEQDETLFEVINGFKQAKPVFLNTVGAATATKQLGGFTIKDNIVLAQNSNAHLQLSAADAAALCPTCKVSDPLEQLNIGFPYVVTMKTLKTIINDAASLAAAYIKRQPGAGGVASAAGLSLALRKHDIDVLRLDNLLLDAASSGPEWLFATARIKVNSFTTKHKLENPCAEKLLVPGPAPWFLRAQGFVHEQWRFDATLLPDNVFACDMWLLSEPGAEVWAQALATKDDAVMRHTYGICTGIKTLNALLEDARRDACRAGYNRNKQLQLVSPRGDAIVRVGHQSAV
ncbi:hypothetical protein SPRG_11506 [Saprolegnia parasitica CBS 223.65]|uniref:Uncharacterized protein n=1 Tax=Saprolegnia parasitica (strain CBS 223.65) TaxID=695850 RepID=A0A067BYQ5_SAPPC|nr:hypothetical protein SPRG_11506 [Saprolegnia parasitica CBS 223.65]KDO23413.1 hypothetical protein SPRG_11506 [Saprolegnia parasitica CBS 223.65]|eukprot:XP_012205901.1 hypothetical protein SPRG_11506 [Saprolegnia parasitica CBS 223.65]